ncbi:helicase HerA domain-containing protein [Corallococcus llansteffanensis]|uniref:helicase HerA domain-containing protein n=1 Tax=Corallococcus llansteffanensis TaxID=2316731 RepID=UPI0013159161|nr:DUF87 domain-containing protein [Corallococcus llansteffanensis]
MISQVIELALVGAAQALPPKALGLRCHSLPLDDCLDECLDGIAGLLSKEQFTATQVVVGTAATPSRPLPKNVQVFPSDLAAAEATRIRNDRSLVALPNFLLVYLNSGSTPGEAGLERMLVEIKGQAIARYYAQAAGLELLNAIGASNVRMIGARLEDTSVEKLGRFAVRAQAVGGGVRGELEALPLLGFVPNTLNPKRERPSALWKQTFDSLTNQKFLDGLRKFRGLIPRLSTTTRERLVHELEARGLAPTASSDILETITDLVISIERFSVGLEQDPERLCGLSRELLNFLRQPGSIEALLREDNGSGNEPGDKPPLDDSEGDDAERVWREEEVVSELGAAGLEGRLESIEVDQTELKLSIRHPDGTRLNLRGAAIPPFLRDAAEQFDLLWKNGGSLEVASHLALLSNAKPSRDPIERFFLEVSGASLDATTNDRVAALHAARREFLSAIAALVPGDEDSELTPPQIAILLLESVPITVAANARDAVEAYLSAYGALVRETCQREQPAPHRFAVAVTNLDMAFSVTSDQRPIAARLLPTHPLRLTRAQLWLGNREEPPPFPSSIVLHVGQMPEALYPQGEPYCFHARYHFGPSREGLMMAAKQGMQVLWNLLAPRGLMSAVDVELVDVSNPSHVIQGLYEDAVSRFALDNSVGENVHLRVICSYSEGKRAADIFCPTEADLPELAHVWGVAPGAGVTLELVTKPVAAGTKDVHLSLQAVETPYLTLNMPSSTGAWNVEYIPGRSGNIRAIELTGVPHIDDYRRVLKEHNFDLRRGFDPANESGSLGQSLVKTFVAPGGWPIRPDSAEPIAAYEALGRDVAATLIDGKVFDAGIADELARISNGAGAESSHGIDLKAIREGMLALYPCRKFIAKLLDGDDPRNLLGWLGILRAFREARSTSGATVTLAISLDGSEGTNWARVMAREFGGDQSRADLLIIEAAADSRQITRIRVAELKARTTQAQLSTVASLARLATQALLTASRLRATLGAPGGVSSPARQALRRLLWLGAGQQRAAYVWKDILTKFDDALVAQGQVSLTVDTECWLVPETEWGGDERFSRSMRSLNASGTQTEAMEDVHYRVLPPVTRPEQPAQFNFPPQPSFTVAPLKAGTLAQPPPTSEPNPKPPPAIAMAGQQGGRVVSAAEEPTLPEGRSSKSSDKVEEALPHTSPSVPSNGIEVRVGTVLASAEPALWRPNRTDLVTHFNVGITGTMGTGKTQLTKSLVAQLLRNGHVNPGGRRPGIIIFDYKGDYIDTQPGGFAHTIGAKVLEPYHLPINPLHLKAPTSKLDLKLAAREFADTIRTIARVTGEVQRAELIAGVQRALANAGIDENEPQTWGRPFPTIHDLYNLMDHDGLATGAPMSVIHDLADLEIFAPEDPGNDLGDFFDAAYVIDLRKLVGTDAVIRSVISFFMNGFFARMVQQGESLREPRRAADGTQVELRQLRRLVLVDEADDFMGLNLSSLKNVMQQGRAFGCGVILSTQFLHHFDGADSPLKPLIGTWILHRMADVNPNSLKSLFGLQPEEAKSWTTTLSSLEIHTSLCYGLSNRGQTGRLVKVRDLPFFEWQRDFGSP